MEVRMKKSSTKQAPKGRIPPIMMMKVRPKYQGWSGTCGKEVVVVVIIAVISSVVIIHQQ